MRSINEKCAVIGVSNTRDFDVARLVYLGLWSLQHRGQDSSGIASFDGVKLHVHKKRGLVSQVYDEDSLAGLKGQVAIGHNRYSTSGGKDDAHNQPYYYESINYAFAHNGNLPFVNELQKYLDSNDIAHEGYNDTGLMSLALKHELGLTKSLVKSVKNCWPLFTGAFSCVGLYEGTMFAFRDSYGIRPLVLGKTSHGYIVASETVALDIIGADFIRDIAPGELVCINGDQLTSTQITKGEERIDAFEFVYLARPDSRIAGMSVYTARYKAGKELAKASRTEADVVIATPDSGLSAATGYAHESGIPLEFGLLKNRYIGRTFIEPEKIRKNSVELKFNVIVESVAGKRVILVDDSLVRGNTLKYVIGLLKSYGAKEVHVRIASPPVKYPDFYGIDTPKNNDLIASEYTEAEITQIIKADSLEFLGLDQFIKSTGLPKTRLNLSSFNGVYPIPVPEN
jgi:amidophosphoribosyltransferase